MTHEVEVRNDGRLSISFGPCSLERACEIVAEHRAAFLETQASGSELTIETRTRSYAAGSIDAMTITFASGRRRTFEVVATRSGK